MIIPIPPSHCNIALHRRIDFGTASKFTIIVDPVVVIPDILSKKESVIDKFKFENIKGNDPNTAIVIQDKAVNRKAWGKLNFFSWSKFERKKSTPKIMHIIDELIKEESNSLKINWIIIGILIDTPSIICKTPKVKKTVL